MPFHSIGNDPIGAIVLHNIECENKREIWITLGQENCRLPIKESRGCAATRESNVTQVDIVEIDDLTLLKPSQVDRVGCLIAINRENGDGRYKRYFGHCRLALGRIIENRRFTLGKRHRRRTWRRCRTRLVESLLDLVCDEYNEDKNDLLIQTIVFHIHKVMHQFAALLTSRDNL